MASVIPGPGDVAVHAHQVDARVVMALMVVAAEGLLVTTFPEPALVILGMIWCSAVLSAFGTSHLGSARSIHLDARHGALRVGGARVDARRVRCIECLDVDSGVYRSRLLVAELDSGPRLRAGPFSPEDAYLLVDAVAALSTSSRMPELIPLLWFARSGLAAAALGGLCSTAVFHAPIAACLGILVGAMLPLPLLRRGSIRRLLRVEESPAHVPESLQRWYFGLPAPERKTPPPQGVTP